MKKPKLMVIPDCTLQEYEEKGHSTKERISYYNPNNEFDLVILGYLESGKEEFVYGGVKVYSLNQKTDAIGKIIEEEKPDMIHGYNTSESWLTVQLGKEYRIPTIISVHNLNPIGPVDKADLVICFSEEIRKICLKKGVQRERTEVIQLEGIDFDKFQDYSGDSRAEKIRERYG